MWADVPPTPHPESWARRPVPAALWAPGPQLSRLRRLVSPSPTCDHSFPLMETHLPPILSFSISILLTHYQLGSPSHCTACILPTAREYLLGLEESRGVEIQSTRQEREKLRMIQQREIWGDNKICEAQVLLKTGAPHFQALSRQRGYQPLSRPSPSSQML